MTRRTVRDCSLWFREIVGAAVRRLGTEHESDLTRGVGRHRCVCVADAATLEALLAHGQDAFDDVHVQPEGFSLSRDDSACWQVERA